MFQAESKPEIQSAAKTFQDERLSGLGGSDAGAVYNLGYKCGRMTCYEKRGTPQDFPKVETDMMERGIVMEHVCKMVYERRTQRLVTLEPLARHPVFDFMMVHIDGETHAPEHAGPGYAEFKVVGRFPFQTFKRSGIRDEYILQLQHGMAVKDYQWGSFGILCLEPWDFAWFDVARDQLLLDQLIEDESILWAKIQNGPLPDKLVNENDKRCLGCPWRRTCRGKEFGTPPVETDETKQVVSAPELLSMVQECTELGTIVDEAKELHEGVKVQLKTAIGDRYGVVVPGYRALLPPSYPERVDGPALKAIEVEAKKILASEREEWDLDALETRCTELLSIVLAITKVRKKATTPERSLRIYPTGD